ncbi:MAG: sulfurtransferase TusA family protein [Pseudomonadota bacterium]
MDAAVTIDASGLLCPLPVLKLQKAMKPLGQGQVACLVATDPAAVIDVPHFCNEQGHRLVETQEGDAATRYFVAKG